MDLDKLENWEEKLENTMRPYIIMFEEDLEKAQLSPKTIRGHIDNAELFLITYGDRCFAYADEDRDIKIMDVLDEVDDFVGYFFIHKCLWSTPSSVRTLCASLKKLFKCLRAHDAITSDEYEELMFDWKDRVDEWASECAEFNGGSMDDFPWF